MSKSNKNRGEGPSFGDLDQSIEEESFSVDFSNAPDVQFHEPEQGLASPRKTIRDKPLNTSGKQRITSNHPTEEYKNNYTHPPAQEADSPIIPLSSEEPQAIPTEAGLSLQNPSTINKMRQLIEANPNFNQVELALDAIKEGHAPHNLLLPSSDILMRAILKVLIEQGFSDEIKEALKLELENK